jgi:hypothetical protein
MASLESITRDDLLAFHARELHPGNMIVAAAGQFDRKAMIEALDKTLGTLKPGKDARVSPPVPAPDFPRTPGIYVTDKGSLRARGVTHWPEPTTAASTRKVKIARLNCRLNEEKQKLEEAEDRLRRVKRDLQTYVETNTA